MIDWSNENAGFLGLILFIATIVMGWVSGIFKALRRRPKFVFSLNQGPTFTCTYETERKHNNQPTHRTAIALYIKLKNVGSAPSSISKVKVGYHNYSFKYSFFWFWLDSVPALCDFGHTVGENIRIFPFLMQPSAIGPYNTDTYLLEGKEINGVVYFEQEESFGSFFPKKDKNGLVKIKVAICDAFGKKYSKKFKINNIELARARKFNPEFGNFLENLRSKEIEEWKVFK